MKTTHLPLAPALLLLAVPAHAEIAPVIGTMLDDAIANGDAAEVDTIAKYARKVNPEAASEIDARIAAFRAAQNAKLAAEAAAAKQAAEGAPNGLFDRWKGQGELGAFASTGNNDSVGFSAGITLERDGEHWRNKLRATGDYQRTNGATSREAVLASWEPNYKFDDAMFAYGLAQYESDKFQGYRARYAASGGVGYRAWNSDTVTLDLKAGPAWRQTDYTVTGRESSLAALAGSNFSWKMSPSLTLLNTMDAYTETHRATLTSLTSLDAKLGKTLSARFSYRLAHESNPPVGVEKTDTLTRMSLVYGF